MRRILLMIALLAAPVVAPVVALGEEYLDRGDDLTLFLAENPPDIAILGEVHDNPAHHRLQAQALAALHPKAVVFEMLTPQQAAAARAVDPRNAAALRRALNWDGSGWPDFALYAPVFAQVPRGGIRGAALPREEVRRAMTEGAARVFGPQARSFGLTRRLPGRLLRDMQAEIAADHCGALPAASLPGMIEAQRLRDAAFARATLAAYQETGGPVALITGTGHARMDRGVPSYLRRVFPKARLFVLGQGELAPGRAPDPREDALYDLLALTAPVKRPDPCLAFRK